MTTHPILTRTLLVLAVLVLAVARLAAPAAAQGGKAGGTKGVDAAPAPAGLPPWIDTHVHLRLGQGGTPAAALAAAAELTANSHAATLVVLPQPAVEPGAGVYDYDGFTGPLQRFPGRFAFLGGNRLNQTLAATPADKVSDAVKAEFTREAEKILAAGAAGFGEISILHLSRFPGHPYQNVPGDHPLLLLLADIAGRAGKVIDLHMDFFDRDAPPPAAFRAGANPPRIARNTDGLARLLAHNRTARIVLAHFGSDVTEQWSNDATRRLLVAHPNLYMSIKLVPAVGNQPFGGRGVADGWIALIREFPDRFVIGSDSFFSPGPATAYMPAPVYRFLMGLPDDVRAQVAWQNAARLYGLAVPAPDAAAAPAVPPGATQPPAGPKGTKKGK